MYNFYKFTYFSANIFCLFKKKCNKPIENKKVMPNELTTSLASPSGRVFGKVRK
jgi:hypothetical protein